MNITSGYWRTVGNRKARVLCTDAPGNYPVIGYIENKAGGSTLCSWNLGGLNCINDYTPNDLTEPWTSPIASGHNPDKLTEEQVEVDKGWRLLSEEEHKANHDVCPAEWWDSQVDKWRVGDGSWLTGPCSTLRTKMPPGYFLPEKKRVPCGPEDFPPGTAVRRHGWPDRTWAAVVGVGVNDILVHFQQKVARLELNRDITDDMQRSLDNGKTWLPCYKEIEE